MSRIEARNRLASSDIIGPMCGCIVPDVGDDEVRPHVAITSSNRGGGSVVDVVSGVGQRIGRGPDAIGDAGVGGSAGRLGHDRHAQWASLGPKRDQWGGDRERVTRMAPGQHLEAEPHVGHAPRHRTLDRHELE